jgi:hypothetical protein
MKSNSSRRSFLAAGLGLPAAGLCSTSTMPTQAATPKLPAGPDLRYRTLGRTGLKVTTVGFGCMITSDPTVIERAADIGINLFDTARGYQGGNNERMVGGALKRKRKDVLISSKSGARSKQGALDHLDTSLRELGTDHLDIWYLHGLDSPAELTAELVDAQQTARKAGKIRFAGVSTHGGHAELIPGLIRSGKIDVLLTTYNFSMDPSMTALVDSAHEAGMGVVAMKVMAGGNRKVKPGDPLYGKLQRDGAMLAALRWVLKNPNVDTTIPSMTDMDQLDENLEAMASSFTEADRKLLAAHLEHIRPLYCRMCGACDGTCPKGLPVADVLRYLMYAEGYGQFALGREQFLALPEAAREVRCGQCESCAVQCANGVHVAERLIRAQELFA